MKDSRIRSLLAAGCLLTFLGFEISQFPFSEFLREWSWFRQGLSLSSPQARLAVSFGFDPGYGQFLEGVRAATPVGATIALEPPRSQAHALYIYQAWYTLAPRRIVGLDRVASADYVAAYRTPHPAGDPMAVSVPFGSLRRRR